MGRPLAIYVPIGQFKWSLAPLRSNVLSIVSLQTVVLAIILAVLAICLVAHSVLQYRQQRTLSCAAAKSSSCSRYFLGLDFLIENAWNVYYRRFAAGVRERFNHYGTTHTSRILHRRIINTIDPRNLEVVMKTNFQDYGIIPGREKLMRVLFGSGVFATDGENWRHSRLLVRTGMAGFQYDAELFDRSAEKMLVELRAAGDSDIDFGRLAFSYTFDLATKLLLGRSPEHAEQFEKDFVLLGKMARILTIFISQIPFLAQICYGNKFAKAQRNVFAEVDGATHEAQVRSKPNTSILAAMTTMSQDPVRIRSEILNLLLAGHDTVGIALSELFYCLARSPDSWSKLREEVWSQLRGRLPSRQDLKSLTYLVYTINEAIRLRPTLSVHGRRAIRDTVLPVGGGEDGEQPLFVAKGTYIVYSNYALYRNPAVFGEDIDSFRPARWEDVRPATFEYLNFGAGPRFCPGREMGWTMLAFAVVRIAQTVEHLEARDERPWEEARAFSFHNRHGVHIGIRCQDR